MKRVSVNTLVVALCNSYLKLHSYENLITINVHIVAAAATDGAPVFQSISCCQLHL